MRLHFPPVCGRGTARDGLRTEGRVGSERKLLSSPVHNVAVWACIFVSFCAEKKRKEKLWSDTNCPRAPPKLQLFTASERNGEGKK